MTAIDLSAVERRELVRRTNDAMWNRGDLSSIDRLYAPNCMFHDPSFRVNGIDGIKSQVSELRAAHPDLHMDVADVMVDGDMTCTRWTLGGTARGEFRGIPGTGKTYVMTGMTIDKWSQGKIVEVWTVYDLLGALQQVGVIPEMAMDSGAATTARQKSTTS